MLAAGDASGRILVWRGLGAALEGLPDGGTGAIQLQCTTVHWHAHPVGCLAFTTDSSHLLSGGMEATLVGAHPSPCSDGQAPHSNTKGHGEALR